MKDRLKLPEAKPLTAHQLGKDFSKGPKLPPRKTSPNPGHTKANRPVISHLPEPGILLPGQQLKGKPQTDTVRTRHSRTGTVIEREKTPFGVVREVEPDERFTPDWDKEPGQGAALGRVQDRAALGQVMTPKGGKGLDRRPR